MKKTGSPGCMIIGKTLDLPTKETKLDTAAFDDGSVVVVTESDLDGYDASCELGVVGNKMLMEPSLVCRVQFASQAAISRLSCLWVGCHGDLKPSRKKRGSSIEADELRSLSVDIRVY